MTEPGWTKEEFAELTAVGRLEAARVLTQGGGFEIEDVVAQSLEELWKARATSDVDDPRELMRTITRERALSARARYDADHDASANGAAGSANGADGNPPGADALQRALDALSPEDRRIAELTYFGAQLREAPEVAEELGIEPGTVRVRLVAIRRELAVALTGR
jgi:RNA polymerase sigma factor (sigma-70 family)